METQINFNFQFSGVHLQVYCEVLIYPTTENATLYIAESHLEFVIQQVY